MLSVGVFIDLFWTPQAGGHVKSWERFAEAAVNLDRPLDLTLHFLGEREQTVPLSNNVRYVTLPAGFSTERLPLLKGMADFTDLAPINSKLISYLSRYDVLQSTHALFSFGSTIRRYAHRFNKPLLDSVHTDVPQYTRIVTADLIRSITGNSWISKILLDYLRIDWRAGNRNRRKLERFWRQCEQVIVSHQGDFENVSKILPEHRIQFLRRGVDFELFNPAMRNRQQMQLDYGIPENCVLLLYVGRLEPTKNIMIATKAIRKLIERKLPVHAIFVGSGRSAMEIKTHLGKHATLTGNVDQKRLGALYAGADLMVFPSETETFGNVIIEAKCAGTAVAISSKCGAPDLIHQSGVDGIYIEGSDPQLWADKIAELIGDSRKLAAMGVAARAHIEAVWPSWRTVLEEDLIPVWQQAARAYGWQDT